MNQESQETAQKILEELLEYMDISAEVRLAFSGDVLIFNIRTEDSGILIGSRGVNLEAFQHLARVLVAKKIPEPLHFVVDVEGYKEGRENFLREVARQAADRVRNTKENLLLKPMLSYERRVVHEEIAKLSDIITESVGEEPERRVLIKPRM